MLLADEPSSTAILLIDGGYERFDVVQAAEGDKAEGRRRGVKWRTARRHRAVDEVADDRRDQLGKPQSLTSCSALCTEREVYTHGVLVRPVSPNSQPQHGALLSGLLSVLSGTVPVNVATYLNCQ